MANNPDQQSKIDSAIQYGADTRDCSVECVPALIRKRAYQLFEERGHQPGQELDDWLQAEREIYKHLNV
jgi:hypothetical protein